MNPTTSTKHGGRAAAAVVWALALLLLPPMACSGTAAPTSSEQPGAESPAALVAMLPAEATTVGFVDFAALRSSPLYDFAKREGASFGDPEELEEIIAESGIDPRTDLRQIAFVSRGSGLADVADASAVLAVANFDRGAIEARLAAETSILEYGGRTLYELASWRFNEQDDAEDEDEDEAAGEDDEEIAADLDRGFAVVLDDSTIAFGGEQMLHEIIDVIGGTASARSNARLMSLLEDVDENSQLWLVSVQDGILDQIRPGDRGMPQISIDRISSMIVSARLSEGLSFVLRGRTDREDDAKLLGDSLNGMLAFGKMMLQSNSPDVFQILDRSITAGSNGFDVTVRAELSIEDIEALYAFARTIMGDSDEG